MHETLSINEARKLILLSQRLPWVRPRGRAVEATLAAIRHLGYIQIDTISVIERAHHHTLWNRNPRYRPAQLDRLLERKAVFEYWSHAAAYLPMEDYRFCLPRMRAIASGERHWFERDPKVMGEVLARIRAEGPLQSRDFESAGFTKTEMWDHKPAKRALDQLFMEGVLMCPRRENFNKVYDLTERVLPADVDTRVPDEDEYFRYLVTRFLNANGLGQAAEMGYLRRGARPGIEQCIEQMLEAGDLVKIRVRDADFITTAQNLSRLDQSLSRKRLRILSPFDNLVIQRKRMQFFFDFDFQIECYVPAARRKFGYFCLPVLWDGRLVGRLDCKADRSSSTLIVRCLAVEPWVQKREALAAALSDELVAFAGFNDCDTVRVDCREDRSLARQVESACRFSLAHG